MPKDVLEFSDMSDLEKQDAYEAEIEELRSRLKLAEKCEELVESLEQPCQTGRHPYVLLTAEGDCPECRAEETIERVRSLPRYSADCFGGEFTVEEDGEWVSYDELEAALYAREKTNDQSA